MSRRWVAPLAVVCVTFLAFWPALNAGFVSWDDDKNFVENFAFRGLGAAELKWMWSTFHLGHYVPLSWMTLGFDYLLWGMNPRGYHLTNLILHCGVAVVVFLAARRVLAPLSGGVPAANSVQAVSSVDLAAAVAALVFAVHPLRVESVAWVTERRDVLSGLFYFTTAYCYLRAGAGDQGGATRRAWYSGALVAALAAMLSKASAVTLPVALLALEAWRSVRARVPVTAGGWSGADMRGAMTRVLPFALLAAGTSAVAFIALQDEVQLSLAGKLAVSAYSLCFYLVKTVLPMDLSPLYSMPERVDISQPIYLLALAMVICATGVALSARRRWPAVALAWIAFVVVLFPLLGVHQNGPQVAADRYTYNASVALALLAGGAWQRAHARFGRQAALVAGAIVLALATLTWRQSLVWHDSGTLWSHVLRVEPASPVGRNNMGNLLMRAGRIDEAMLHYRAAIAAKPGYAEAHDNLGVALAASGRLGEAIVEYQRAIEIDPSIDGPRNNWGVALARQGDLDGAIEQFRLAIIANPANSAVHVNWGNAAVRLGRTDEAIAHYEDALRHRPDNADAHHNWGVALARVGRLAEAAGHFERALAIQPSHAQAREYLERTRAAPVAPAPPIAPPASARR